MAYFIVGNEQEGRIGPSEMALVDTTLITIAEPLLLVGFLFSNTTAASLTARVNLRALGAAVDDSNRIIGDVPVAANDNSIYNMPGNGIPVSLSDIISGFASGAGLNITVVLSRRNR